jgi:hypothetical protein
MFKKAILTAFFAASLLSCSKDDTTVAVVPDTIADNEIKVTVTMPKTIAASDVFVLAGSFKVDAWTPDKSTFALVKNTDGTFSVKVKKTDFDKSLDFKVVRNPKNGTDAWKFVEKDDKCAELAGNRQLADANAGKEVKFIVANFRNTGSCPD